uniref:Uncharacterized protein n=1 Tax=Daphnia galeata TaxID=27404 RepID=A0A8J2RGZ9_9CRUS|nr:unnamed protein product [Daphnia galeata]
MMAIKVLFFVAFVVAAVFAVEDKSNNQQDLETSEGHLRGFYGGFGGLGYGGYGAYGGRIWLV